MAKGKKVETIIEDRFTKQQIVNSKKFKDNVDLLNALLKDDKLYTLEEVNKTIEDFRKGKVN
ncbi:MAG TPA: hypothetical protein OIM50_04500 [Clostridiaceae bacterium]|jgi:hypothetical protein|nr:MAG TPA: hypothetical protein [Caudoviricetes sp.]HBJ12465.1 hypothetical protein [Clostridiales bacterium]HJJ09539.1 hypothetical protein [Clostridiaceae bacterium]